MHINKDSMFLKVMKCIDDRREDIIDLGESISKIPETGFRESSTVKLVADQFQSIGLSCSVFGDVPGVKVTLDSGREGPGVAILAELDAVICPEHPQSSVGTGAVHACGHNCQVAAMFGAAAGILESGIKGEFTGKLHFIAVPAEEYIELDYRQKLREKGIIGCMEGKPELLRRGYFDDVDISIMIHSLAGNKKFHVESTGNGFLFKKAVFLGKAAHAGGAPHEGINALYAANLGLMAINAIRETFLEENYIRVHPIIVHGGEMITAIPSRVQIETLIRGKTIESIMSTSKRVDMALAGGALALGAKVEIEDIPGCLPFIPDSNLTALSKEIMQGLAGDDEVGQLGHVTFSTDMGDISSIMPVMHSYVGGVDGGLHSAQFRVVDHETAYVSGAKLLAGMAVELLRRDAAKAGYVISQYKPIFSTKRDYFNFIDSLHMKKSFQGQDLINYI